MAKKVVKRKIAASEVQDAPEATPKKQKSDKTAKKPESKAPEASLDSYQAGGLSSLFGKSSDGVTVQEDVAKGATAIEKPKRRKYDPKQKQKEAEEAANAEGESAEGVAADVTVDGDGEGPKKRDRTKQRENRTAYKSAARASQEENAKTIFVGNMPLTMSEKSVKKIFSEYGDVESVRMRNLIPASEKLSKRVTHLAGKLNDKQTSLTFFVKFSSEDSVEKALKYNGTTVEEHVIRVDKVGSKKKEFGKDHGIFVGNLPFDITEDALISFFKENIGEVEAVRIVRDKLTGVGKGFAFVNFKQDSSVSLALGMETIKMEKRDLRITKVMKKGHLTKIDSAKKRNFGGKQKKDNEISGKMHNFKFSTKKQRTTEQNDRRALKKSAQKAIKKKKAAKQGRLMA